jgi:hypothetical protein
MSKFISVPEIAKKHNADESQIRKKIKEAKIKTIVAVNTKKKAVTAIAVTALPRLFKAMPTLKATKAKATDVPVSKLAESLQKILGWKSPDIGSTLKRCESRGVKLTVKKVVNTPRKKNKGASSQTAMRPVKVVSKKDYDFLISEAKSILRVA